MADTGIIALSAAIAVFGGMMGAGTAIAIGTSKATEAVSRQPEAADKILRLALIGFAFAEATAIYGLLIAFILSSKI